MIVKKVIKDIFKKKGYEIIKPTLRNNHFLRRMMLFKANKINKVLDVGANIGQYGKLLREIGYEGKIISFEPLQECYNELVNYIKGDNYWEAYNYALGDFDGTSSINIAGNKDSSSLLEMLPSHIKHRPNSKYIGKEKIEIHKLDSIFNDLFNDNDNLFLKIDAQGYEYLILEGAKESLPAIKGIQLEMSLEELYKGEKLMCEMISYLGNKGFKLMSIEPGAVDNVSGQMFQVDGIFFK